MGWLSEFGADIYSSHYDVCGQKLCFGGTFANCFGGGPGVKVSNE